MAEIQISYINIYIYVTSDDGNLFYEQRASTRDRINFNIFLKVHFDQDSRYLRWYFISFEFASCSSSIFLIPPLSLRGVEKMEMSYSSFIVKSIEDPVTLRTVVLCPRNTRNSRSLSVSSRRKFRRRRDSEPGEFQLS